MNKNGKLFDFFYSKLLSGKTKERSEVLIIAVAIISFVLHLLLIVLADLHILPVNESSVLLSSPIAAIYTPFSFILIYEVYLLVYYLPKSTAFYIGKQYEIITLIIIRRMFKDLSRLELTSDWFRVEGDLQFTYDLVATLVLFFLIYAFYRLNEATSKDRVSSQELPSELVRFIRIKNIMAMCLVPIFLILAVFSLSKWVYESFFSITQMVASMKDVNKIFFDEFFTVLILTDVLLLLLSFLHTDNFSKVIRNSGFIISTILIKISFGIEGPLNTVLIVIAVLFGVGILAIHNLYRKLTPSDS
ncbi:MAG: hypothetical protein EAZ89_17610 [Bacteroidetes bacterium]|nr:MAG: hypothetical protein EAZ89_17610 [Bacteroidota bacterium]